jgi:hypothetical protein
VTMGLVLLSQAEANCLADLNNPGFDYESEELIPLIPVELVANVADAFYRLCPGSYGRKWGIDEAALLRKIVEASREDLLVLGWAITQFWREREQGKGMEEYYPCQ